MPTEGFQAGHEIERMERLPCGQSATVFVTILAIALRGATRPILLTLVALSGLNLPKLDFSPV